MNLLGQSYSLNQRVFKWNIGLGWRYSFYQRYNPKYFIEPVNCADSVGKFIPLSGETFVRYEEPHSPRPHIVNQS